MEKEKYYLIILTLDLRKNFFEKRDNENIKKNILKWAYNLKLSNITLDGPFYDVGENNNHHINLSIKENLSKDELLKGPFKGWKNHKGYVWIEEIKSITRWKEYARRNNYKNN